MASATAASILVNVVNVYDISTKLCFRLHITRRACIRYSCTFQRVEVLVLRWYHRVACAVCVDEC